MGNVNLLFDQKLLTTCENEEHWTRGLRPKVYNVDPPLLTPFHPVLVPATHAAESA